MARFLLVDVSNTFTKSCFSNGDTLGAKKRCRTAGLCEPTARAWIRSSRCDGVVISSVVPSTSQALRQAFRGVPTHFVSYRSRMPIEIAVRKPGTVGADRIANAVAAFTFFGAPAVVVDCGTAITFDVLSKGGAYIGGAIAAGLNLTLDYFRDRTALLPRIAASEPASPVGATTRDAMLAGAVLGARGGIREILRTTCSDPRVGGRPFVIGTGGDSGLLLGKVKEVAHLDSDLTLRGLLVLARMHFG